MRAVADAHAGACAQDIWSRTALVLTHGVLQTPPGGDYDNYCTRRIRALRRAVPGMRRRPPAGMEAMQSMPHGHATHATLYLPMSNACAVSAVIVENSPTCPTNNAGKRMLPDSSLWVSELATTMADIALKGRPYVYKPSMTCKPNNSWKWLMPFVAAAQVALWTKVRWRGCTCMHAGFAACAHLCADKFGLGGIAVSCVRTAVSWVDIAAAAPVAAACHAAAAAMSDMTRPPPARSNRNQRSTLSSLLSYVSVAAITATCCLPLAERYAITHCYCSLCNNRVKIKPTQTQQVITKELDQDCKSMRDQDEYVWSAKVGCMNILLLCAKPALTCACLAAAWVSPPAERSLPLQTHPHSHLPHQFHNHVAPGCPSPANPLAGHAPLARAFLTHPLHHLRNNVAQANERKRLGIGPPLKPSKENAWRLEQMYEDD